MKCALCQREASAHSGFCDEHRLEYEARQREGVSTEALDPRWGDTLDNWRERPSSLEGEIGSKTQFPLRFRGREGDWLLFVRGYQARLADGLAINGQTAEIRRFVDVSEETMREDLRGERPAPYQAELAAFWGSPFIPKEVREQWEWQFFDARSRILLPKLVSAAPFPIYGLASEPPGFSFFKLFSWGTSDYQVRNITLTFRRARPVQGHDTFELTSFDARSYSGVEGLNAMFDDPDLNANSRLLQRYHLSPALQREPSSVWKGDIVIGREKFVGEIRYWAWPLRLSLFELKSSETVLIGDVSGLSFEELEHLLRELVVINHLDDLLIQYQHALEVSGNWYPKQ